MSLCLANDIESLSANDIVRVFVRQTTMCYNVICQTKTHTSFENSTSVAGQRLIGSSKKPRTAKAKKEMFGHTEMLSAKQRAVNFQPHQNPNLPKREGIMKRTEQPTFRNSRTYTHARGRRQSDKSSSYSPCRNRHGVFHRVRADSRRHIIMLLTMPLHQRLQCAAKLRREQNASSVQKADPRIHHVALVVGRRHALWRDARGQQHDLWSHEKR
jgi:hypothetical protein